MINGTVEQWLFAFSQTEKFLCITNYIKKKYNLDSNLLPIWDYQVNIQYVFRDPKYIVDVIRESKSGIIGADRLHAILATHRVSIKSFYYIEYILQHTKEKYILDVGCGENFFANFYDEIQGMEPNQVNKDLNIINEAWNDEFIQKNIEKIPNIIATTSLHHVYGLFELSKLLEDLIKVLKSGGYCYISFNLRRLLIHTTIDEMKDNKIFTYDDINKYFKRELQKQLNMELIEFSNDMDFNLPSIIISPSKVPYEVHVIKVSKNANVVDKFFNTGPDPCIGSTVEGSISILFKLN
jgi:hypothetical protein